MEELRRCARDDVHRRMWILVKDNGFIPAPDHTVSEPSAACGFRLVETEVNILDRPPIASLRDDRVG